MSELLIEHPAQSLPPCRTYFQRFRLVHQRQSQIIFDGDNVVVSGEIVNRIEVNHGLKTIDRDESGSKDRDQERVERIQIAAN